MIAGGVKRCCIDPIFIHSTPLHPSRIPELRYRNVLAVLDKYSKTFQHSTPWT
jgi:hypothetical protein